MDGTSKHDASRGRLNSLLHTLKEGNPEKEKFTIIIGDKKGWLLEWSLDEISLGDLVEHYSYWHPKGYSIEVRREKR